MNKPLDQQSDCWSTEAFASDSETHSEDGSNILRLAHNYHTNSTLSINDSSGRFSLLLNRRSISVFVFLSTFVFY
jgi:hypothetical protein